jgi:DNA adenine methylase
MKYQGGKSRIAKHIAQAILGHGGRAEYLWEPFCGGCGITPALCQIADHVFCTDAHPALISMWRAVHKGWEPPDVVLEKDYRAAKNLPDTDPCKAFIGFGCSFGGKWFGGYARGEGRNYAAESRRSILRTISVIRNTVFDLLDFVHEPLLTIEGAPIIYCDPPYASTTNYAAMGSFDSTAFWRRAREYARQGARVYVSEYRAPEGWKSIWSHQKSHKGGLRPARPRPSEQLFIHSDVGPTHLSA